MEAREPLRGTMTAPVGDVCTDAVCITCSDQAAPARVVALDQAGMASVEAGGSVELVSVALVEAHLGDTVLVHAGEAIAVVSPA